MWRILIITWSTGQQTMLMVIVRNTHGPHMRYYRYLSCLTKTEHLAIQLISNPVHTPNANGVTLRTIKGDDFVLHLSQQYA